MDIRAHTNTLLQALCEYRGVRTVTLDAEDRAELDIGGRLFVFAYIDEMEELLSLAYIAPLPQDARRGELVSELLRGCYAWAGTGGGALGLDEESDWVCLSKRYHPEQEEPNTFLDKVAIQAGLVDHWQKTLSASPVKAGSGLLPEHIIRG
jgi:hypothetical protein